jgi:hypothetical protein
MISLFLVTLPDLLTFDVSFGSTQSKLCLHENISSKEFKPDVSKPFNRLSGLRHFGSFIRKWSTSLKLLIFCPLESSYWQDA